MINILKARETMYGSAKTGGAVPKTAPAAPVTSREEAGRRMYALSMKPHGEQKHYQAAQSIFATPIVKAQGDRQRIHFLERVRDQAAAVSAGLGLDDEGSKRFLSRIAQDVNRPKTRGDKLADAERAALEERYGPDKPLLTKRAEELVKGALVGKPELYEALKHCDAAAHLDVVEPIFAAAAKKLAAERTPPEPQTQSTENQT